MRKSKYMKSMVINEGKEKTDELSINEEAIMESEDNGLNASNKEEWLRIVYEEAWRQYVHEDEMAEQRDTKYLTILSLIITGTGLLLSKILFEVSDINFSELKSCLSLVAMLVLMLFMLLIIILFSKHWDSVTDAGQLYTKIRFDVVKRIEDFVKMQITLAKSEEEQLNKYIAENMNIQEGFSSTHSIIRIIKNFSMISIFLVLLTIIVLFVNLHFKFF